jgi:uncharacterized OsmC-like protein
MRSVVPPSPLIPAARTAEAWFTHLGWTEEAQAAHIGLDDRELAFAGDDQAPRDLLCAALAACADSTIRRFAARMGVRIERLAVIATGDVDERGAAGVPGVPVGFQSMRLEVQLRLAGTHGPSTAHALLARAERHCVLLQTLAAGVPIELVTDAS